MASDTKTLDQFLAENPNVDVSRAWEKCWGTLSDVRERIAARFETTLHPSCKGREYYTSPDGAFEGSFQAWYGPEVDWLVGSWLGNRKASILDMNATAWLGQQTDVPHFVMVFGTVPKLFFYFDLVPRRNLMTDTDYLDRYYGDINDRYLALRGNENFQWSVSHGTYMRSLVNPSTQSLMGDLNDDNINLFSDYAYDMLETWLGWLDVAEPVPNNERGALRAYDHRVRWLSYERDPMNKLAVQVFGEDEVDNMLALRMGQAQMKEKSLET